MKYCLLCGKDITEAKFIWTTPGGGYECQTCHFKYHAPRKNI